MTIENMDLHRTLGKIEGKLDTVIANQHSRHDDYVRLFEKHNLRLSTHSDRLRAVERRQSWFLGGLGAIGTAAAAAWAVFTNKI